MLKTAVLGYPRIGENRELKKATESYWKKEISQNDLKEAAKNIRCRNWLLQKKSGIDIIPSNDFSFYDQMLDMTALLGAVPPRFNWDGKHVDLDTYFAMARGSKNITALEMTKWFDTNYHYLVPEFYKKQTFKLSSGKPFEEFKEALALGIKTRPVLIGPVTYLTLGKEKENGASVWDRLENILEVYGLVLRQLSLLGAEEVQIDEPALVLDLTKAQKNAFKKTYEYFAQNHPDIAVFLTPYFGPLKENLKLALSLPVKGLHLDLSRAPEELAKAVKLAPKNKVLSLGIVDGRNIWKNDLEKSIKLLSHTVKKRGAANCLISSSCSLIHSPVDLEAEKKLSGEFKSWLSFARQKLGEIDLIRRALAGASVKAELEKNKKDISSRKKSPKIHKKSVSAKLGKVRSKDYSRQSIFKKRQKIQKERFELPLFPTTTIGSFPQTAEVRQARAEYKKGTLSLDRYNAFLKEKTKDAIRRQEEIGLDVLVHGEFERNDMVEYFGEKLDGFLFTQNGWVQSYGTRCVKPPVVYGDVERPEPMTLEWTRYAQSLTKKPVKGMLTGPITILQWSFVRDDQPRSRTAQQIALAIREEVRDLENAGVSMIQIDEPALREGLPLRKKDRAAYLRWAVDAFRLAVSVVRDETQIHTHMCYSEFNDIIKSIAEMDADVISIETSRSQMELLDVFVKFRYPNEIGPGVYDIHSPRVPSAEEMKALLEKAAKLLPKQNLWVNPDCGLKTRGWEETVAALKAMVQSAKGMRAK